MMVAVRAPRNASTSGERPVIDRLDDCTRHRPSTPIEQCVNLAVAGTGSSSLLAKMTTMLEARTGRSRNEANLSRSQGRNLTAMNGSREFPFWLHHDHSWTVAAITREFGTKPCFVMTLRDPLERLSSGFRYEAMYVDPNKWGRGGKPRLTQPQFGGLGRFVALVRNGSRLATRFVRQSKNKISGPTDGSYFMKTYESYLRGVRCSLSEVHFLCTPTLDHDWDSLVVNVFNLPHLVGNSSQAAAREMDRKAKEQNRSSNHWHKWKSRRVQKNELQSDVTDEMAHWVRHVMLREDMQLYERVCLNVTTGSTSLS